MTNELRVRKSPHGSLVVYEMRSPLSVGWRVVHVGHGDFPRLGVGYWITNQEAALWQLARFGPDPARVAEDAECTGAGDCPSRVHLDGCFASTANCSETHDVATGYGVLRCDLTGPHALHRDPAQRISWRAAEAVPRAH